MWDQGDTSESLNALSNLLRLTLRYIHNVDSVVVLSSNRSSNQAELPKKVFDFREFENEIQVRDIRYNETKFS